MASRSAEDCCVAVGTTDYHWWLWENWLPKISKRDVKSWYVCLPWSYNNQFKAWWCQVLHLQGEISFVRCNPETLDKWNKGRNMKSVLKHCSNHTPKKKNKKKIAMVRQKLFGTDFWIVNMLQSQRLSLTMENNAQCVFWLVISADAALYKLKSKRG